MDAAKFAMPATIIAGLMLFSLALVRLVVPPRPRADHQMSPGDWQYQIGMNVYEYESDSLDEAANFMLASSSANPADPITHFEAAYLYGLKGDTDHAIEQNEAAVALDPNFADARNNLGYYLEQKGRYPEAVAQFQEVLRRAPENQAARNNLAGALAHLSLVNRKDGQALLNAGIDAVNHGSFVDGLGFLLSSIEVNPRNPVARFEAGYTYSLMGDLDHAIAQTQAAVALDPNLVDAHNNLGFYLEKKGRYREAVAQFQEAVKRAPGNALARNNLAAALPLAALMKGADWRTLLERGIEAAHHDAPDAGLAFLLASISANAHNPVAHDEAGIAYGHKGDVDRAIEQTQAALSLDPNMADAHDHLGVLLEHKGRYREAIAQFQEALKLAPENQPARNRLGDAIFKLQGHKSQS